MWTRKPAESKGPWRPKRSDFQIVTKVRAALRALRASRAASAAARSATEEHIEDVADAFATGKTARTRRRRRTVLYGSEAIVLLTFARIGEHFVSFVDFFKVLLGRSFIFCNVGMILEREPAVCFFYIGFGRVATDTENGIEIGRHEINAVPFR